MKRFRLLFTKKNLSMLGMTCYALSVVGCGDLTTERQVRLQLGDSSGLATINLQKVLLDDPASRSLLAVDFSRCDALDPPEIRDLEFVVMSDASPTPVFFPVAETSDGTGRIGVTTSALSSTATSGLDVLAGGGGSSSINLVVPDGFPSGTDYRVRAFGVIRYNAGYGTACENAAPEDLSPNTALHLVFGEVAGVTIADQGPTDANLQLTVSKDAVGVSTTAPTAANLSPFSVVKFTPIDISATSSLTLSLQWASLSSSRRLEGGVSPEGVSLAPLTVYHLSPIFPYRSMNGLFRAVDGSTPKRATLTVEAGLLSGQTAAYGNMSFAAGP